MKRLIFNLTMLRSKQVLTEKYSEKWFSAFHKRSKQKFNEILPAIPKIGKSIFSFNYQFAPSYIAWYTAFMELEVEKEAADGNLWIMHEKLLSILPKNLMRKYGKIYFNSFRRKAPGHMKKQNAGLLSPYDWKIKYVEIDKNSFELNIKTCGFQKLAKEYGVEGLLPGICRIDYLLASMMNNGFERTTTLGDGDDCCNGKYHITGKCIWEPEKGFVNRK